MSLTWALRPLKYVNPHIFQWTKTWKNITNKYFFRKWLNVIYRFCYKQQHTIHFRKYNMKKCRILIITAHRMCISTMLQCMHLMNLHIVHVQGFDQKYFWTWNKISHCSAIYWFNIHHSRLHFLKIWLKHNFSVFWYLLWRMASRDPS